MFENLTPEEVTLLYVLASMFVLSISPLIFAVFVIVVGKIGELISAIIERITE